MPRSRYNTSIADGMRQFKRFFRNVDGRELPDLDARPNALRVSRRLEGITSIDREGVFLLPAAKMAPIQPVGYTRLLGLLRVLSNALYFRMSFSYVAKLGLEAVILPETSEVILRPFVVLRYSCSAYVYQRQVHSSQIVSYFLINSRSGMVRRVEYYAHSSARLPQVRF